MLDRPDSPTNGERAQQAPRLEDSGSALPPRPAQDEVTATEVERLLGYRFARRELLVEALTHRSYVHEFPAPGVTSNERLEFLGDAVLALVSADLLFTLSPASGEGELTAARAALVRTSTLATFARHIALGAHLRLGRGEVVTGGRERDLLLASAFEAVVGALYVDGGLAAARHVVGPLLQRAAEQVLATRQLKDSKSLLQELAQARLGVTPTYRVVAAAGPSHEPRFAVEVLLGEHMVAQGEGRSKRQAEQAAAARALEDAGWLPEEAPALAP